MSVLMSQPSSARVRRALFSAGLLVVIGASCWSIVAHWPRGAPSSSPAPAGAGSPFPQGGPPPAIGSSNYSQIDDGLWQGGSVTEPPEGTTAVLNLCEAEDRYRCDVHEWRAIPDAPPAPDIAWLRGCVEFVADQRDAGRTVYVHCAAGVSRSGMVTTAYIMARYGKTRDEALEFVRRGRPITNPNPAFLERLLEWEAVLKEDGLARQ